MLRRLVAVLSIAALFAACASGEDPSSAAASPSGPVVSGDLPFDVDACPLGPEPAASAPGPEERLAFDDAGEIVLAESTGGPDPDAGPGRVRLCLEAPFADVVFEVAATCTWGADRKVVRAVTSGEVQAAGERLGLQLDGMPLAVHVFHRDRSDNFLGTYRTAENATTRYGSITASDAGSGVVAFTGLAHHPSEPTSLPLGGPGAPKDIAGVVRWACDAPPAPQAGLAVGRVMLRIDGIPGELAGDAVCRWVDVDGRAVISSVDTLTNAMTLPRRELGLSIYRSSLGQADLGGIGISVTEPGTGESATYQSRAQTGLAIAPDHAAGAIRYRNAEADGDGRLTIDGTAATVRLSGIARWACDPPLAPAPVAAEGPDGEPDPLQRGGRLALSLDEAGLDLEVAAQCVLADDGGGIKSIEGLDASIEAGGETIRFEARFGSIVLHRSAADGTVLGEYVVDNVFIGQEARLGPHTVEIQDLRFEPTDPRYVPFGGPGGPRVLSGTLEFDCRDPNEPPSLLPDQTLGQVRWTLDEGETWTTRAACTWEAGDDARVVRVESVVEDRVILGGQELRFLALPDPRLIVTTHNGGMLTYRERTTSTVNTPEQGISAASGRTAFKGLGFGRLSQGHLKLGGVRGAETVSGEVQWECRPR